MVLSGVLPFLYRLYLSAPVLLGGGLNFEFVRPYVALVISGFVLLALPWMSGVLESKRS
jgi:hypothetical protein